MKIVQVFQIETYYYRLFFISILGTNSICSLLSYSTS